jgi:hypothetical protein
MAGGFRVLWRVVRQPFDDYRRGLLACLPRAEPGRSALIVVAAAVGWWVYVPVHELLHAAGCWLAGGEVTRLEIDAWYGGALLQRVFPFVAVGSAYAGQLTGFDTRGSDLIYLCTDLLPFTLTVGLGVPALRRVPGVRRGWLACTGFGATIPVAYAPFVSLTGDFYEIGSIVVTRLVALGAPGFDLTRWRSDDVLKLAGTLFADGGGGAADALGIAASALLGTVLAFATYAAGAACSGLYGRRHVGD